MKSEAISVKKTIGKIPHEIRDDEAGRVGKIQVMRFKGTIMNSLHTL